MNHSSTRMTDKNRDRLSLTGTKANTKLHATSGFTLIEMLVVIAIIAVLVAIVIPVATNQLETAREATDGANIRTAYGRMLMDALSGEKDTYWDEESGIYISEAIAIRQSKTDWQNDELKSSITGLGSQIGEPKSGGAAYVEFHPNGDDENPTVIIRYTDKAGETAINYAASQSVGKYVFSEVQKQLDMTLSGANENADYNNLFKTAYDKTLTTEMTLPNGQTVNVIVYSRRYDTFEYVQDRFKTDNTATLIYNRSTGSLSTIIYYDGTNYSSWSVAESYGGWAEDGEWLDNEYRKS